MSGQEEINYYVHALLADLDNDQKEQKASLTAAMEGHVLLKDKGEPMAWVWDSAATTEPSGSYCIQHNPCTKTPV